MIDVLEAAEVLDFEEKCYQEGYDEGIVAGTLQGFTEGRELGIQTGFQRYLSLGVLQGRIRLWNEQTLPPTSLKQLDRLRNLVDLGSNENSFAVSQDLDIRVRKGKSQARMISVASESPAVYLYETKLSRESGEQTIEDL